MRLQGYTGAGFPPEGQSVSTKTGHGGAIGASLLLRKRGCRGGHQQAPLFPFNSPVEHSSTSPAEEQMSDRGTLWGVPSCGEGLIWGEGRNISLLLAWPSGFIALIFWLSLKQLKELLGTLLLFLRLCFFQTSFLISANVTETA